LKLARAIAYLENAIRLNPTNARNCLALAIYLACQGRIDDALDRAAQAVEADPLSPRAHVMSAEVHDIAGQPEAALRHIEEALQLDPHLAQAEYYRGLGLTQMGKLDGGARALGR